jgi:hypothetical protein
VIAGNNADDAGRLSGILTDKKETPILRDLQFFTKNDKGVLVEKQINEETGSYEYEANEKVYAMLPEETKLGGTAELFETKYSDICLSQACTKIGVPVPVSLKSDNNGLMTAEAHLPDQTLNKQLVAIYTEPVLGSTVISAPFLMKEFPYIVAFVTTPLDIPTNTPGVATVGSDTLGEVTETAPGAGGMDSGQAGGIEMGAVESGINAGAMIPKACSLIADNNTQTRLWGAGLWWIIFTTLPTAAFAVARNRKRK